MKKFVMGLIALSMLFDATSGGAKEEVHQRNDAITNTDAVTVMDNKGIVGQYPGQYDLAEFEKLTGEDLSFSGNPLFSEMSEKVDSRIPTEPLVMAPLQEIGIYGNTLRVHSRAPESGTSGVNSMRHANLVRMSDDYQTIVPDVAKSFSYNNDYTELTFELREGHKWSDGHPFTTEDILFWWEDIQLNSDLNSSVKSKWVFGGETMKVTAIDDTTIKFSFAVPTPGFIIAMAVDFTQPYQPKHVLQKFHASFNKDAESLAQDLGYKTWEQLFGVYYNDWKCSYHPLSGAQPTIIPTLESHVLYEENTEHRRFKANPYYHIVDTEGNQLPYTNEIYEVFIEDTEVTNLKITQGEIDYKSQGIELLDYSTFNNNMEKGDYNVQLISTGTTQMPVLGFNLNHKDPVLRDIFSNVMFKQAMSLAINRDEINELIFLGTGKPMAAVPALPDSNSFITEEMVSYVTDYDVTKANALLDEIGLNKDSNGKRTRPDGKELVIYLTYTTQGGAARVWELIKDYWDALGIRVELKEVNSDLYHSELYQNNLDVVMWHGNSAEMSRFYDIGYTPFLPFMGSGTTVMAIEWGKWVSSNGNEGEEPPTYIKNLLDLYFEFTQQGYQSDNYYDLAGQMAEIVVENLFLIGSVGDSRMPLIEHNRVGNVGEVKLSSFAYYYNYPVRPCQWFLKY